MKKVILLRHAKSSWDNHRCPDHDRPLADRGIKASGLIGKFLKKRKIYPETIISSTAKRAKQTLKICMEKAEMSPPICYDKRIYDEGMNGMLRILKNLPGKCQVVMLAGHNPGMIEIVEYLTGEEFPYPKFPTAGLAIIKTRIKKWSNLDRGEGKLSLFVTPGRNTKGK